MGKLPSLGVILSLHVSVWEQQFVHFKDEMCMYLPHVP